MLYVLDALYRSMNIGKKRRENGVNERLKYIVRDVCLLSDKTPHNDVLGILGTKGGST